MLHDEAVAHMVVSALSGAVFSAKELEVGWSLDEPKSRCNIELDFR